tara:strand:- start:321 stop:1127 length:807 start_codon:yes stop_codon:yes gene_type:complete
MDFSNVKLVVSDLDGTLLNEKSQVSKRFLNQFKELKKRNIHFIAASGRQYQSILDKLNYIKDDITIIAENGGLMLHKNEEEILFKLSKEDISNSIKVLRKVEDAYIVLCGRKSAYIETNEKKFVSKFSNYYSEFTIVEDLEEVVDDDFLKIAVFHFESSEDYVFPYLKELTEKLKIVVSGQNWLDISHLDVDKSFALDLVQKDLDLKPEETMVFGDYNNDLKMLELGHYSFAMKNAHSEVKKIARFQTKSNNEEGVEEVIDKLLNNLV